MSSRQRYRLAAGRQTPARRPTRGRPLWLVRCLSGDLAVVGAGYAANAAGTTSGVAYVFRRSGSGWTQAAKLLPQDAGEAWDVFGYSVSISGNTAIVGALQDDDRGTNSGSAYIFQESGSTWTQVAKLTAGDGATGDGFGCSVSISGATAAVGAYGDDDKGTNSGSVYLFQQSPDGWTQVAKVMPPAGSTDLVFGTSVVLAGDRAIVGSPGIGAGSAYVMAGLKRQDDFLISVRAGDRLVVATSTPGDRRAQDANSLDPLIELFDPGGQLVAHDDNGAADGRNASLSHTATATGTYLVRVQPVDTSGGEYVLQVTGHSGTAPKFQATVDADGFVDVLPAAPAQLVLQFSGTVLLSSLAANDLTVDGAPSKGWTAVDGHTIAFDMPAGLASGTHVVRVAAGAILDVGGTPVESLKFEFTLDTTPPVVGVVPSHTFDTTPPLSGTIDDPQALIQVTVGGKTYSAVNRGDGTWTLADDVISPPLRRGNTTFRSPPPTRSAAWAPTPATAS